MQYGAVSEIAKKLKTSRQNVNRVKKRMETGENIHSKLSKRISRELKKAQ